MNTRAILVTIVSAFLFAGCAGNAKQESTGEYIDDAALTANVKTRLLASKETSGLAIKVETFKGTVQLSGFVDSAEERQRAGEIASAVKGVVRVENKLSVK
tara:strand:- start:4906 stop:5208 length:303 start_codon:yes stop_codon:yes gene_type:complete